MGHPSPHFALACHDSLLVPRLRIWSPPSLQDFLICLTGTGLLSYIRPVDGGVMPLASMKCARIVLFVRSVCDNLRRAQVFNTPV